MWAEIGITANVEMSSLATYDAQNRGRFQASIRDGTAQEISNIWIIYESSFGSRVNGNDDLLDAKLMELRRYYPGDPKRAELLDKIADYLFDIRFSYPFMTTPAITAVSDKLAGFEFHPNPYYYEVWNWKLYE
jgi:ABC-type transport system substrate-binding protein